MTIRGLTDSSTRRWLAQQRRRSWVETDDLEGEVPAVGHSGDMYWLNVKDLLNAEATVTHQSDCNLTLERGRHAREGLVLRPREPEIPGGVFVLLCSHCVVRTCQRKLLMGLKRRSVQMNMTLI
jgi:hypothetical protein